jgi:hypothetical protein
MQICYSASIRHAPDQIAAHDVPDLIVKMDYPVALIICGKRNQIIFTQITLEIILWQKLKKISLSIQRIVSKALTGKNIFG